MSDNDLLSDDLWIAARAIWENTTKITDRDLIDQLAIKFGDDAPKSNGTISKRRKKEEWTKNTLNTAAKRVAKAEPKGKVRNQKGRKNTNNSTKTNKAQNMEKSYELEPKKEIINGIIDDVIISAQGRAKIIQKYRKRYACTGTIFDDAIKITLSIPLLADEAEAANDRLNAHLNKQNNEDSNPADFVIGETTEQLEYLAENALNRVKKAIMLSATLTETAKDLAAGLKLLSEVDMPMSGISADDFMQSDQSRRMGAIAALGDINEKEQQARENLLPGLFERLKRIEAKAASDDFGRTDLIDDDDIDDVDYTAID